ncbi:adenylate/guanylate cyclase domain-containing protein [Rhabdothermincola sp.]|uniref:adenylate/guanylate cyclase domain-containing protein n=1 Tax=Rhabdothermincola sp. TaxID=2820405 RepID=UPI002FDF9A71
MSEQDAAQDAAQVDLRSVLADLGVPPDEIERAEADGTLELLALERVVWLEPPTLDLAEVAALSGVSPEEIRAYWRALGFPDPRPGEKLFTERDVEMLSAVVSFIAEGTLEPDLALQMARVVGSAMDRIATAQVDALQLRRDARESQEAAGGTVTTGAARNTAELLSLMPRVMELVWRRQVAHAARRRMMRAASDGGADTVVVGFADMVGFTAKTQQLEDHELAEVVDRFETVAYDVVNSHGGRVVKMIGDEVMFLHDDVRAGAELALALAERFGDDPALSDVRVGLACGPVLERDGDVYGQVVNLANRIVSIAYPGSVVVSEEVHDALADHDDLYFRSLRSHYLKDIGKVPLWVLRRTAESPEAPYRDARERRAAREFLREQWAMLREEVRARSAELSDLPELLRREIARGGPNQTEPTTGQFEALTDAVLEADLQPQMQVELLADLEVAQRLRRLEEEAQAKAAEADEEAERRLEEIEREARQRIEHIEREARLKIERALAEAEEKSRRVNEEASRKVERVAIEAERKAERAAKEAKAEAQRKAKRRSRDRNARNGKKDAANGKKDANGT